MSGSQEWRRATRSNPCRICGKDHACKVSADGAVALCKRVEQGAFSVRRGGWYLHRLDGGGNGRRELTKTCNRRAENMGKTFQTIDAVIASAARAVGGTVAGVWSYQGTAGREVMRVVRFDLPDGGKEYRPLRPVKGGWQLGDPAGPLPLYRLPEFKRGEPVWVFEGEKAADAARGIGLNATTSAHGASAAENSDWTPLAGSDVNVSPDNDGPGRGYARDVAGILLRLDPPARVKIVQLPGLPEAGDVADFIDARQKASPAEIRREVEAVAAATALMDPADVIGGPVLTCLADVKPEPIEWLWPDRVALGKLTLLSGDPGLGKSFVTIYMAARVTTGTPWPDSGSCPAGSVILMNAEDSLPDTVRPRLDSAGADASKVAAMSGVRNVGAGGNWVERGFTLGDVPALAAALRQRPDCKLVVIDPVSAYMGKADSHNNAEVRSLLAPLAKLAQDHRVAVVIVTHLNKNQGAGAVYRSTGSIAFTAACRSVWAVVADQDDASRRLLLPVKNNIGNDHSGLAYRIIDGAVVWEPGPVKMRADDALASERDGTPGPAPEARTAATEWLGDLLSAGPMEAGKVKEEAEAAGHAWRTVHRAKDDLGIQSYRGAASNEWTWRLPDAPGGTCQPTTPPGGFGILA